MSIEIPWEASASRRPSAVRTPRAVGRLDATVAKAEREWQRLCGIYLPIRPRGSIWRVSRRRNRNDPSQGWKLHVSATILSACSIFRLVAPYLKQRNALFKGSKSLKELGKL